MQTIKIVIIAGKSEWINILMVTVNVVGCQKLVTKKMVIVAASSLNKYFKSLNAHLWGGQFNKFTGPAQIERLENWNQFMILFYK